MPRTRSGVPKLRGDAEFRRVLQGGTRAAGRLLAVRVLPSQEMTRAGFIAGRTIGGAVARNRARRLMREAWQTVASRVLPGTHVVFLARGEIEAARTADVAQEMAALLRRTGVLA
ncbi:MAG: ribonuclease P protein component [Actinomycetota bacterium]|nr:ribonuclease P protein component [Actinomycetota bacterium]